MDKVQELKIEVQSLKARDVKADPAARSTKSGGGGGSGGASTLSRDDYYEDEEPSAQEDEYPRVVVSYQSAQVEMLDEVNSYFESWGFHVWDGRGVKAGKNWIAQWCQKAMDESTVLIVFLLSEEFLNSQACYDEFFFVMGDKMLNSRALPLMCNAETMGVIDAEKKWVDFKMKLGTKNYVHPIEGWHSKMKEGAMALMDECKFRWPEPAEVTKSLSNLEEELAERWATFRNVIEEDWKRLDENVICVGVIGSTDHKFSVGDDAKSDDGARAKELVSEIAKQLARLEIERHMEEGGAKTHRLVLVTGGCTGFGAEMARAFDAEREKMHAERGDAVQRPVSVYQFLPEGPIPGEKGQSNTQQAKLNKEAEAEILKFAGHVAPLKVNGDTVYVPDEGARFDEQSLVTQYGSDWKETATCRFGEWRIGKTEFVGMGNSERQRFLAIALPIMIMFEGGPGAFNEAKLAMARQRFVIPIGYLGGMAKAFGESGHKADWMKGKTLLQEQYAVLQRGSIEATKVEADPESKPGACSCPSNPAEVAAALSTLVRNLPESTASITVNTGVDLHMVVDAATGRTKLDDLRDKCYKPAHVKNGKEVGRALELELLNCSKNDADQGGESTESAQALHDHQAEGDSPLMRRSRSMIREAIAPDADMRSLANYIEKHGGNAVLIDGHGKSNQFFRMDRATMKLTLKPVIDYINGLYGEGKWLAIYGGDPDDFKEDDPYSEKSIADTGFLMRVLADEFKVRIVATQCDIYADYFFAEEGGLSPCYSHLKNGAALLFKTTIRLNEAQMKEPEYGGFDAEGNLVGASRLWFSAAIRKFVRFELAVGGGPIAQNNLEQCLFGNPHAPDPESLDAEGNPLPRIPVLYVPYRVRNCGAGRESGSWFGQINDWVQQRRVKRLITKESKERLADRW